MKATEALESMGYKILSIAKPTANGPDLHIIKNGIVLRVEIKKARKNHRSMQVPPVEPARKHDDLIAIEFPSGYVLIEPMADHLTSCADKGTRSFFGVY